MSPLDKLTMCMQRVCPEPSSICVSLSICVPCVTARSVSFAVSSRRVEDCKMCDR